jgi:hypothetical protein
MLYEFKNCKREGNNAKPAPHQTRPDALMEKKITSLVLVDLLQMSAFYFFYIKGFPYFVC